MILKLFQYFVSRVAYHGFNRHPVGCKAQWLHVKYNRLTENVLKLGYFSVLFYT